MLMINNFGEKGFYNSQEIGLAKALVKLGNDVTIYKLLSEQSKIPTVENGTAYCIVYRRVKSLGINGFVDVNLLNKAIDAIVFFVDTQLNVPKVAKWCDKNNVKLLPYIGVMESHSSNFIIRSVINALFTRNISVFKRTTCLAKNTDVAERLQTRGVKNVVVTPVGVDLDLLNKDYAAANKKELLNKHGFQVNYKTILFVERLEDDKCSIKLVDIFEELRNDDDRYKLLMIGKGYLKDALIVRINNSKYKNEITYIERVPNSEIWELYRISDSFVNLNRQEIFGMVFLEAMYYEAKVVAWRAQGPELIIENGKSGYLVTSTEAMKNAIRNDEFVGREAHKKIIEKFTWDSTARSVNALAGIGGYRELIEFSPMQHEFEVAA